MNILKVMSLVFRPQTFTFHAGLCFIVAGVWLAFGMAAGFISLGVTLVLVAQMINHDRAPKGGD